LDDFVGPIEKCSTSELNGLNATIKVIGTVRSVKTMAFYVPDMSIRLFLPQGYFTNNKIASLFMDHAKTTLKLNCGTSLEFPYNDGGHLPLMLTTNALN
jgi:hypothetical protein